jgi:small-conductance mechanosensitive channel
MDARTQLHNLIDSKFRAEGLVIAFPQMDVHLYEAGKNVDI